MSQRAARSLPVTQGMGAVKFAMGLLPTKDLAVNFSMGLLPTRCPKKVCGDFLDGSVADDAGGFVCEGLRV